VSCFTHSVSQSVCCALSLHCRPSAFCVIAQQQQKLLVSFCWTTAYDLSFSFILCSKSLLNSLSVRPSELRLAVVKDTTLPFLNFGCCCLRLMVLPFGHLIRTCSLENFCFLKRIILLRLIRIYSVVIIALFLQPVRTVSGLYVLLQPELWNRIKIEHDGLLQGQCSR
jgi:hypothetical protein